MQDKKKAPSTAATMQGASKIEHNQEQDSTKSGDWQGFSLATTSLEAASLGLTMAESLCTLLAQGMGEETGGPMQPERVGMYADSLWVLFRFLEGLQGEAKAQADHFYQERRRVP